VKKWIIAPLTLALLVSMTPAYAQQKSDSYITIKKSDLPPDTLKKTGARGNPGPTKSSADKWFFLMSGATDGFPPNFFTVAGPFKDQADCNEINGWSREQLTAASRCWHSGD